MSATLLLLKGEPGAGKSTLGRALAARLRWAILDKDDARNAMPAIGQSPAFDWNTLSYDILFKFLEGNLACGVSVILDCPLARRELYDRAAALAQQVSAERLLEARCVLLN